jgi:hypothetical protein
MALTIASMDGALHIALTDGDSIAKSPRAANPERPVVTPLLSHPAKRRAFSTRHL